MLYVVATPIGNREDITIRALKVLTKVDLIAAEDTRHTNLLLSFYDIKTPLISYHDHNEKERTPTLIHKLKTGLSVALVSNAGTPCVSDPGYRLIKEAIANKIQVVPIPGASAAITSLSVSGFPNSMFVFIGFLAKKKGKRVKQLQSLAAQQGTIIFYESTKRILNLLYEIIEIIGDRYTLFAREMTKQHEEFIWGSVSEIIQTLKDRPLIKGECTLLLQGYNEQTLISIDSLKKEIQERLKTGKNSLSDIARIIAQQYGVSKSKIYKEAIKIKKEHDL